MINTKDKERLIAHYLNGDFSQKDERDLFEWISEHPDNKKLFLTIKDTWDASLNKTSSETEQLLQFYKKKAFSKRKRYFPAWVSGAAVAAVLVVGLVIGTLLPKDNIPEFSQLESFDVPKGSRSQLTLADGTIVSLNSDSHLELCKNFSFRNREVTLLGEAYFEVKADKENPFTVKTEQFDITVTGTKFNVSSYSDDNKISATLTEGIIQLDTKLNGSYILEPGEKISYDQKTMKYSLECANIESELAWVDGDFYFKEIPFTDLIRRLERWYDVKLDYNGFEFDSLLYSGRFKNQETIWQVLDALKLTTPIDYTKTNFREFKLKHNPM